MLLLERFRVGIENHGRRAILWRLAGRFSCHANARNASHPFRSLMKTGVDARVQHDAGSDCARDFSHSLNKRSPFLALPAKCETRIRAELPDTECN